MNNKTFNTKFLLGAATLALLFTISSCKSEPKTDSKEAAEDQNEQKFDDVNEPKEDDSAFLVAAAEVDMMEITLGKLALSKTSDAKVKDLANMMIAEHTAASAKTKALAAKMNVTLPGELTEKGKEHYDDLAKKSGKDFDKEYADMMVKGHEETISKMEDASKDAHDAGVRQWASDMLPALNTHLQHSKTVQDQLK